MLTPIQFLLMATMATAAYGADACFQPAEITKEFSVTISANVPIPGCGLDASWEEHPPSGGDVQAPSAEAADGACACFDPSKTVALAQATAEEAEDVDACFPPSEGTTELPPTISANVPIPGCGLDASWEESPLSRGNGQELQPAATTSNPNLGDLLLAACWQPSFPSDDASRK